jgi:polysaccharide pyruvyl transferase WcaK-like protein
MKIFFVGDTSNRTNWGCRATTRALRSMVSQYGEITYTLDLTSLIRFTGSQYRGMLKEPPDLGKHTITNSSYVNPSSRFQYINNKLANKLARFINKSNPKSLNKITTPITLDTLVPRTFDQFEEFADKWINDPWLPYIIEGIQNTDVIVINGEGSFRNNNYTGRFKLFISYLAKKYFGTRCIIVNHTSDVSHPGIDQMAEAVYPLLDDAVFREHFSLEKTGYMRKDQPYTFAADAVFTYQPVKGDAWKKIVSREDYFSIYPNSAHSFDPYKPYICVGGSAAHQDERRKEFDPVKSFIKLCKRLQQIAPVVLTGAEFIDEDFLVKVAQEIKVPYLGTTTPTYQAIDVLANASLYIGGRWHPSIMALTGGTPIISLSANTKYKSQGILRLVDLEQPNFDFFEVENNIEDIVELAQSYLEKEDDLRSHLLCKATELKKSAPDNVRFLKQMYGSNKFS